MLSSLVVGCGSGGGSDADGMGGAIGATGPAGPKGDQGEDGATGPAGPKGDDGDDGATGPAGSKGSDGEDGATGPTGATGAKGDPGDAGPTGATGEAGPPGDVGAGCELADDGMGTVTLTCGEASVSWPKALCAGVPYEPTAVACVDGALCGNGQLDAGEHCDDGNINGGDSCPADCRFVSCGYTVPGAAVSALAPDGGSCLAVFTTEKNWMDAEEACITLGGHLASIDSVAESEALRWLYGAVGANAAYLGGSDLAVEEKWEWTNGALWNFTAWGPGEPNNADNFEHCLMADATGAWNDIFCAVEFPYVCEMPK